MTTMSKGLDHLPEGKQHELAFVVDAIRKGFAFAMARRTMPKVRGGRLLKITCSEAMPAATGSKIRSGAIFPTSTCCWWWTARN